jgi:phosphocarrier protein HPr
MQQKQIIINKKLGLHARAAVKFVTLAPSFSSAIDITKDHQTVNGKSIMDVMMLAASGGTSLTLTIIGVDEEAAAAALERQIHEKFGAAE